MPQLESQHVTSTAYMTLTKSVACANGHMKTRAHASRSWEAGRPYARASSKPKPLLRHRHVCIFTVRVQSGLQSGLRKTVISVFVDLKDIKVFSSNAGYAEMLVFTKPDYNPDCTLTVT